MKNMNHPVTCLSVFILLTLITESSSKSRVTCQPGTAIMVDNDGTFHCTGCSPGTFSKGHNSVCRPCRACHRGVLEACTATQNAVCTPHKANEKRCRKYKRLKKVKLLMRNCKDIYPDIEKLYVVAGFPCKDKDKCDTHDVTIMGNGGPSTTDTMQRQITSNSVTTTQVSMQTDMVPNKENYLEESEHGGGTVPALRITVVLVCVVGVVSCAVAIVMFKRRTCRKDMLLPSNVSKTSSRRHVPQIPTTLSTSKYQLSIETPTRTAIANEYITMHAHAGQNSVLSKTFTAERVSGISGCSELSGYGNMINTEDIDAWDSHSDGMEFVPITFIASSTAESEGSILARSLHNDENLPDIMEVPPVYSSAIYDVNLTDSPDYQTRDKVQDRDENVKSATMFINVDDPPCRETSFLPLVSQMLDILKPVKSGCTSETTNGKINDDVGISGVHLDEAGTGSFDDMSNSSVSERTCTSQDAYSDDQSSTSPRSSTSGDVTPVEYLLIHNKHQVKDTNLRANTEIETQTDENIAQFLSFKRAARGDSDRPTQKSHETDVLLSKRRQSTEFLYKEEHQANPGNFQESLSKSASTQTRNNCDNSLSMFGHKWDVVKYISPDGDVVTIPTTNMSLTVFENCVPGGETVRVSGRFSGDSNDILPYLESGWVVTSPLAEFDMTYKRWGKHVKVFLPFYQRDPAEIFRVCYYHRIGNGEIEHGVVPLFDSSQKQDLYYIKMSDHVEIFTMSFTLYHCACDHIFPLYLTVLAFSSYNKDENEAVVRLHVGDRLLSDQLVKSELKEKEQTENGTTLRKSTDVRVLQIHTDSSSRLVFKLTFPSNNFQCRGGTSVPPDGTTQASTWENMYPEECPQMQERRFCEMMPCLCTCPKDEHGVVSHRAVCSSGHSCKTEIQWAYASNQLSPPDVFPCNITITHELPPGTEEDRQGNCKEGITFFMLKTPHSFVHPDRGEMLALGELPSDKKFHTSFSSRYNAPP
ncbi:uncharacterized protein LOC124128138 isoform X2 [Haliotis rufescens]|uniref:uncharacterized protein LOC124128138 isoform X2 n=1 Tax=Haliotis rufescens TaxID=6454 RepID=UPI00201F44FE|nr:uncharacterized protein LOC124128138 isoform X2 [Haliotis rufescens]